MNDNGEERMKILSVPIQEGYTEYFEQEIIAKANKKLVKVNQPELRIVSVDMKSYPAYDVFDKPIMLNEYTYNIEIPDITGLDNVEYIGAISYKTGIKTTYSEDDSIILNEIPEDRLKCDHCNINRYRNIYYIFKKDENLMVIGSACAKDYFGHDIGKILNILNRIVEPISEESLFNWSGYSKGFYISSIVLPVLFATKNAEHNWIGKNKAMESGAVPTSHIVSNFVNPTSGFRRTFEWADYLTFIENYTDQDIIDIMERLYTKWGNIELSGNFDYNVYNQLFDVSHDHTRRNICTSIGIVGYAIYALLREENEAKIKSEEVKLESLYQGEIGDRLELDIQVIFKYFVDNAYGGCDLVKMQDENGNVYVWFASGNFVPNLGSYYHIKGTVKKHDEYKGDKQTILTRCKNMVSG